MTDIANEAANRGASDPASRADLRWTARDGATLVIRDIRGDDEPLERAFVAALSPTTSYHRLLSGRTPQADEIARWTHVDRSRERAFVAIESTAAAPRMCGVARYVREPEADEPTAAFAIVLADDWQRRGLGLRLMGTLVEAARADGIVVLSDVTLRTNAAMVAVARRLGFDVAIDPHDAALYRLTQRLVSGVVARRDRAPDS